MREARAAARVHHSNVASVVHLSTTPGNIFYAMEFVAGESLGIGCGRAARCRPPWAVGFAAQVARGLGAIHDQQIVHRDLKPANLMIVATPGERAREESASNPGAWQIKIIDFGLARGFGGAGLGTVADARTLGFRGTTLYASPEQCEERGEIDGRSDQYSLGCILWEMLTGSPPFRGTNHRELLNQHVAMPPPQPRIAHLPAALQSIVTRMLAKDPLDRFPDDEALVDALGRCGDRLAAGTEVGAEVGLTSAMVTIASTPGTASWSRRTQVGIALACATVLVAGAAWFFARDRNAVKSPAGAPPRRPVRRSQRRPPAAASLPQKTVAVLSV